MCLSSEASTGRIASCNQTLLETLGYSEEEVLGASLYDLYHPSQKEKVDNNLWSIANDKRPANTEFLVSKKNGETIEVTLKLNFVKDENGKTLYTNAV
ncbi:MAG: PAS domain-containing protein [Crocinitomicaceae bacterium]|nr:PAS domain-containing protein [Crocinitomicaceae bacterium]